MLRAVDVAAESHSFFLELAYAAEREHLEAAAVGENGFLPAVEAVQAAGLLDDVHAGAEIQVIGIAEYDLRLDVVAQLVHVYAFYGADSAYRHEYRGSR